MNATPARVRFTYEDYLLFPADGRRHELVQGEHIVTPSPVEKHQRLVTRLILLLAGMAEREKLGRVYAAPFDVILSEEDVVQPDVLFVAAQHEGRIGERGVQGAPDLVVEVTSEGSRRLDEVVKRKLYERFGVAEYWVVDPEIEVVKVYRREGEAFQRLGELSAESRDVLATPLLPGLAIPLAALFGR